MVSEPVLRLEYSIEADVSPAFAWRFRTDVANWNDPPATFLLDGPFETGSRGTTLIPGQDPAQWRIQAVRPGESYAVEIQLDRATLTSEWCFEGLPINRTKLTQRLLLSGENSHAYAAPVEAEFGRSLPDGMRRAAAEMAAAQIRSRSGS